MRSFPYSVPVGRLTLALATACSTSLMPTPRAASALGSTCTRTAYFCCPCTWTWATPEIVEMRCARNVSAYSLTVESGRVSEVGVRKKIGESAGFTFRNEGGVDMADGNCFAAAAIAELTSCAAASMSRSSENCMVTVEMPWPESEVIWSIPAIVENCFSSVVATAAAMVSGLAPGSWAETWIVGKSTLGSDETGSRRQLASPKIRIPAMTSTVMTGRRTKSSDRFIVEDLRLDYDLRPGPEAQLALRYDPLTFFQTARDDGVVAL